MNEEKQNNSVGEVCPENPLLNSSNVEVIQTIALPINLRQELLNFLWTNTSDNARKLYDALNANTFIINVKTENGKLVEISTN